MPVTPTGILSIHSSILKIMVSQSEAFQTWVGAANATVALDRIYLEAQAAGDITQPFALVSMGPDWAQRNVAGGASSVFQPEGSLLLHFEAEIAAEHRASPADALFAFTNPTGAILEDLLNLSNTDSHLTFESIALAAGPSRNTEEDIPTYGHRYTSQFNVNWTI